MAAAYDDRDGFIWMDGQLVDWRSANVHIMTHAMHYASSVFFYNDITKTHCIFHTTFDNKITYILQ